MLQLGHGITAVENGRHIVRPGRRSFALQLGHGITAVENSASAAVAGRIAPLQLGHGITAVENLVPHACLSAKNKASIGPRHHSRGKPRKSTLTLRYNSVLQLGHGITAVEN